VDRLTRKELKQDKFAAEITHTVGYLAEHRSQTVRYAVIGVVAVLAVAGFFTWRSHQRVERHKALADALEIHQTPVGPAPQGDPTVRTFTNPQDKTKAEIKAFSDVASRFSGSSEGTIAQYYLGVIAADQGNLAGAAKAFQEVIDNGSADYASLAKLSLADVYKLQGKINDGEQLLRSLVASPTAFVSKEQATIALARLLAVKNPAEARKLLEPLRAVDRQPVSRAAISELGQIPVK
jgi:predicted negative regulator of RcsB-dependent stress response